MNNKHSNTQVYKSIASHALVVAIFTVPYLVYLLGDVYKLATKDTTTVVVNQSLTASMSLVSFFALLISAVAFGLYSVNRKK
jgi:hypothetical protein